MPDYSKGKIYKIVCNETGKVYIGSTVQKLNTRLNNHKSYYNHWLDGKIDRQCASYAIIQFDNYYIELIENYPCNSRTELEMREGYWQKQIECINKNIAGAYGGDKKTYMKNYQKVYNQTDKHKNYYKQRRQTKEWKQNHKIYIQSNKYKAYTNTDEYKERHRVNQKKYMEKKKLQLQENQNNNLDV